MTTRFSDSCLVGESSDKISEPAEVHIYDWAPDYTHLTPQTGRQTDRQTDRPTGSQTDRHTHRQTDSQTDTHTDRHTQTDRQRGRQTHRQTDRDTYRQTDRDTNRKTERQTDTPTHQQTDRQAVLFSSSPLKPALCFSHRTKRTETQLEEVSVQASSATLS